MRRLAALYVTWRLDEDEVIRRHGLNDTEFAQNAEQLDADIAVVREVIARGKAHDSVIAMLDAFLEEHGLAVRPESKSYAKLAYEIAKADVRAMELMKARDRGEAIDTPEAPDVTALKVPLTSPRAREAFGKFTLEDLCEYWKKQKKPAPKTVIEAGSVIRRFQQAAGNLPPAKVERRHVIAMRDSIWCASAAIDLGGVMKRIGLLLIFGCMPFTVAGQAIHYVKYFDTQVLQYAQHGAVNGCGVRFIGIAESFDQTVDASVTFSKRNGEYFGIIKLLASSSP